MSGTRTGGLKAAAKNLSSNPDFYKIIGAKGGRNGTTGGFAANPEIAARAGKKAGTISKRGLRYIGEEQGIRKYIVTDTGEVVLYMYDSKSKKYECVNADKKTLKRY